MVNKKNIIKNEAIICKINYEHSFLISCARHLSVIGMELKKKYNLTFEELNSMMVSNQDLFLKYM